MKAKDYIIIGGAVALYFLWKNKNKKDSTSSTTEGTTTTGGASNQPQQVFGLGLPENMDLPVLTAGTGIPTEVAIQQGGVMTQPRPAIIQQAILGTEEALISSGVRPIPRPTEPSNVEPIIIVPRTEPTPYLADN